LGRELLHRFGSLAQMGQAGLEEMKKCHGLGLGKASQLLAAFELGRRVAEERVVGVVLDSADKLYDHFALQLQHLTQEKLFVVLLNTKLQYVAQVEISSGTISETMAHPREILHPVINRNAYAFHLLHNHPSGDPTPSRADHRLTERVKEVSDLMHIRFIDHVIIGRPAEGRLSYFSFAEAGRI
jgi:DNA repair protein RadC